MATTLRAKNTPITKGLGDASLAGAEDVAVLVDGHAAHVLSVDPLAGTVVIAEDVAPGAHVSLRYHHAPGRPLPRTLSGLNDPSWSLNAPLAHIHAARVPQPSVYAHRYRAWDYPYTATLNDPTSLRLNEPRHALRLPAMERLQRRVAAFFEGDGHPVDFAARGPAAAGPPVFDGGLYALEDASWSVGALQGDVCYFERAVDLNFDHTAIVNARLRLAPRVKDGDFTGVAFGYCDARHLYMVGFLEVGDFRTAALLSRQGEEAFAASYLGLTLQAGEDPQVLYAAHPVDLVPGQRLLAGAAVHTVQAVGLDDGERWRIALASAHQVPEGDAVQALCEVDWRQVATYRLIVDASAQVSLLIGGASAPVARAPRAHMATPSDVLNALRPNALFFGSVSRKAANTSFWDFARFSMIPRRQVAQAPVVDVDLEMDAMPDERGWTRTYGQGAAAIFAGQYLWTQSAGTPASMGGGVAFAKVEPFLSSRSKLDLTASLRVQAYAQGMPASLVASDGKRDVILAFFDEKADAYFAYYAALSLESKGHATGIAPLPLQTRGHLLGAANPVLNLFARGFTGGMSFADAGWFDGFSPAQLSYYDHYTRIAHAGSAREAYAEGAAPIADWVMGARLRFAPHNLMPGERLPFVAGVDDGYAQVYLAFGVDALGARRVYVADAQGHPVGEGAAFAWDDGAFHHYKVARYGDHITLFADNGYLGLWDADDMAPSQVARVTVRMATLTGQVTVDVDAFFAHAAAHYPRRVGLFRGHVDGDLQNPANYDTVAAEWFGKFLKVRLRRDPQGKTQVYFNDADQPAFDVAYAELPRAQARPEVSPDFGYVLFGTPDGASFGEVLWDYVRYTVLEGREDPAANNRAYLNRHNVVTSPEGAQDAELEYVRVLPDGPTRISLAKADFWASQVLAVLDAEGTTTHAFAFDPLRNTVTLAAPVDPAQPLTVVLQARRPYTESYLRHNEPHTLLNDGTPPYPLSQQVQLRAEEVPLDGVDDPSELALLGSDYVVVEGTRAIRFLKGPMPFYEGLEVYSERAFGDDGLLSLADDYAGLRTIDFGGPFALDQVPMPLEIGGGDHRRGVAYLNRPGAATNAQDKGFAQSGAPSPYRISLGMAWEEAPGTLAAQDAPKADKSLLVDYYGSSVFNSPVATLNASAASGDPVHAASVPLAANTYVSTSYPIDFAGPVLYPS